MELGLIGTVALIFIWNWISNQRTQAHESEQTRKQQYKAARIEATRPDGCKSSTGY